MQTLSSIIRPQNVFGPQQTEMEANRNVVDAMQSAFGSQRRGLPGISSASPAMLSRQNIQAGQAMGKGYGAAEGVRLGNRVSNLQNLLAGRVAQGNDLMQQADTASFADLSNQRSQTTQREQLLDSLMRMMSGLDNTQLTGW